MSYDIDLLDPATQKVIIFDQPHQLKGGTYCVGGTREATLNITYNYSKHYYRIIDEEKGIRFLYGKTGAASIPILKTAIDALGLDIGEDYWEPTEGNARAALCNLLMLAMMRPDGIWSGD